MGGGGAQLNSETAPSAAGNVGGGGTKYVPPNQRDRGDRNGPKGESMQDSRLQGLTGLASGCSIKDSIGGWGHQMTRPL